MSILVSARKCCLKLLVLSLVFIPRVEGSEVYCSLNDGMKADSQIAIEHQGKKHQFCCSGCLDQFKVDPEKFAQQMSSSNPADPQEAEAACSTVCSE